MLNNLATLIAIKLGFSPLERAWVRVQVYLRIKILEKIFGGSRDFLENRCLIRLIRCIFKWNWKSNISRKEHLFWPKTFRIFYESLDLSMDKFTGRNFVISFSGKYLGIGQKCSKRAITFEGRAMGRNPFGLFTTLIYSIKWDINESKRKVTPRKIP